MHAVHDREIPLVPEPTNGDANEHKPSSEAREHPNFSGGYTVTYHGDSDRTTRSTNSGHIDAVKDIAIDAVQLEFGSMFRAGCTEYVVLFICCRWLAADKAFRRQHLVSQLD